MEVTPSQLKRANKAIADYMLKFGYSETLDCFKREADFPDAADPEVGSEELRIDDGSHTEHEQPFPTNDSCRFHPCFLLIMSLVQICTHAYMEFSNEDYYLTKYESPLIQDPFR